MGIPAFGENFVTVKGDEEKIESLARFYREREVLVFWDNFESARGSEGTPGNLPEEGLSVLSRLLAALSGGRSKVLITSRSKEDWLGTKNRFLLPLGGLTGEELWEYCSEILEDQGKKPDCDDPDQKELLETVLRGHPLAMAKWTEAGLGPLLETLTKEGEKEE